MSKCLCVGVSVTNNRFPSMCPTRNITELYTTFVGHWYQLTQNTLPICKRETHMHKSICLWMSLPTALCYSFGLGEIVSLSIPPWISLTQTPFLSFSYSLLSLVILKAKNASTYTYLWQYKDWIAVLLMPLFMWTWCLPGFTTKIH